MNRALSDDGKRIEETPKGNRARSVDLSAHAIAILRAQLARRKAEKLRRGWKEMPCAIFCSTAGTYVDPSNVRRAFRRVTKAAGLPAFSPHAHRQTFASQALQAGLDVYYVSRMLGHASIQETADTYGRWLPPNRHGALDVLDAAVVKTPRRAGLQPICNHGARILADDDATT